MYDNDKIKEYLEKLPKEIKNIMYSLDYSKLLQEIVKKNKLMIDQAGKLEIETTLVLAGLKPLRNFIDNLSRELDITKDIAKIIAQDIDNLIFKNIRKELEEINTEDDKADYILEQKAKEELKKEDILLGIEDPKTIKESSVSVSSLNSNQPLEHQSFTKGIEVSVDKKQEIPQESYVNRQIATQSISPVNNIVHEKISNSLVIPQEKIVLEEKTKLPIKETDPYREQV